MTGVTLGEEKAQGGGKPRTALIIGAGIGGLTAAVALRRVGIHVELYERAGELRAAGSGLSVMSNAISALATLDIDLGLEKRGRTVESFTVLDHRGRLIRDLPFREACAEAGAPSVGLSRSALQEALLAEVGDCPLHLGATAAGLRTESTGVTVEFTDGRTAHGDFLIGADGFHSAIRRHLNGPEEGRNSGYLCWLGIVPFQHPVFTPGSVRHYWGSGQRFGLIDIGDGRAYWWGTKNVPATHALDRYGAKDVVERAFTGWAPEIREVVHATSQDDILTVPSFDRPFRDRWGDGPVTLLGDAAHPMLTTLGQGAAMAIEDAVVLAHTLAEPGADDDITRALRTYEGRRRERTRAMVAASREMSDLEQAASPPRRLARDSYFRFTPRATLARRSAQALTFPALPATTPQVRRELSPLERWYWIADQASPLSGVVRARVHGTLPVALLRRALDALQARHPLLRAAISSDGGTGAFRPVDDRPIPLRHVTLSPQDSDDHWEHEVNEYEFEHGIDWREGPLLRATVISRPGGEPRKDTHDLLLTASHCIADGMTGLSLLRQWIELAGHLSTGAEPPATSYPALPAAEDLLPRRHRGGRGAAGLGALMLRDQQTARRLSPQRVTPQRNVPFERRRTRMVHRTLTAEQVDGLLAACKRHGATVHGALAAAMVTAVAQDAGITAPAHFAIGSPVDFRDRLHPAPSYDDAGSYAATLPSYVPYQPGTALWPMARFISEDLARRTRREEHLSMVNLLRWAGPKSPARAEGFMEFMDTKGPLNLCLSNLGRYDFPERVGPWRISDAQLVAGISVTGALIATANTSHGQLAWNFSHIDGVVTPARARTVADASVRAVLAASTAP
ncbi:FAD-dependent monooxygenase [Streptomyces sp. NRRL B-1347]|uniref:FAD-dependent monooxygenase n=1 Tax=Streptomyces sp. NRRL B-1347 TaxID=1476877 RepID=UPI00068FB9D4|nr:FAD-dependent monooxygenase [Streptomyces sp. NRRL B-1347]